MDPLDRYLQQLCGYEAQRKITLKNLSLCARVGSYILRSHIFPETMNFHSPVGSLITFT